MSGPIHTSHLHKQKEKKICLLFSHSLGDAFVGLDLTLNGVSTVVCAAEPPPGCKEENVLS